MPRPSDARRLNFQHQLLKMHDTYSPNSPAHPAGRSRSLRPDSDECLNNTRLGRVQVSELTSNLLGYIAAEM